jgi:predicted kinase
MAQPFLIIVTGPPGTGKTTLGRRLAEEFSLPFIHKDGIKELLFDTLGWSDREWSKRLGVATYAILYHILEAELKAGASLVVESNFHPTYDDEKFTDLHARYAFVTFQVLCVADGDVLYERFRERSESGERHPGHVDDLNREEFEAILHRGRHDPLAIGGETFEIDMTDLDAIDYDGLYAALRAFIAHRTQG